MKRSSRNFKPRRHSIESLEHRLYLAQDLVAYAFFGANTAYSAAPGDIAGGYFIYDANELPSREQFTDAFGGYHASWAKDHYPLWDGHAAIDDALADNLPLRFEVDYVNGEVLPLASEGALPGALWEGYADVYSTAPEAETGGVLRYDGGSGWMNLHTDAGPPLVPAMFGSTVSVPLSSMIASHGGIANVTGGPVGLGSRAVYIEDPFITPFTAEDILANPQSFGFGRDSRVPFVNGPHIAATFTPHLSIAGRDFPVNLEVVALLFGVDHFNWKQTIVDPSLPDGWKVEIEDHVGNRRPAPQPRLDPIPSSTERYVLTNAEGDEGSPEYPFTPDNSPYYYQENTVPRIGRALTYHDSPAYPATFNRNNAYRTFYTQLVGVREDGTEKLTGIDFVWRSNSVSAELVYTDHSVGGQSILMGGISGLSVNRPGATNSAPVANPDNAATDALKTVEISVLENDVAVNVALDAATVSVVAAPQNGVTSVDPVTGKITYTPSAGFTGLDSFGYQVRNELGALSNVATVYVITFGLPELAPTAVNDAYVIRADGGAQFAASSVLSNDSDPDGDSLTMEILRRPSQGTLQEQPDGTFVYTPNASFDGLDTFEYRASDGVFLSGAATVRLLSHNAVLVNKVYQQVLGRDADAAGLRHWTAEVRNGTPLGNVASHIFESQERLDPIVAQMYRDYLFREADAGGLSYWRGIWRATGGPEQVTAGIISSREFFESAEVNGANRNYVREVYERLLDRSPDARGLDYWTGLLDGGLISRAGMIMEFERSTEKFRMLVNGWFLQYLSRPALNTELDSYVTQLAQGASQRAIQIQLINTPEYRQTPPPPQPGIASRLN